VKPLNSCTHLFLLAGPDYSERVVSRTSPSLWDRAQHAEAPNAAGYGLRTIAEIMRGLNPLSGHLYLEALEITRAAREMASLMLGRYPHPSTIFPGGMGIEASRSVFNQVLGRIVVLLDYAKKVAAIWEDLVEFFYTEVPEYRRVGERRANLISTGMSMTPPIAAARSGASGAWSHRA
jgi:hydrogenase large subunit